MAAHTPDEPAPASAVRSAARQQAARAIVRAALQLFAAHGYDAVSTQEIADAVGITQRTLFRYFPQKSQIVFKHDYDYVARYEQYLDAAMQTGVAPFDAIRSAFQSLTAYFDAHRDKVSLIYGIIQSSDELKSIERGQQHHIDRLVAFALDGNEIYASRYCQDAQPTLASRMLASVVFATIRPMYRAWLLGELAGPLTPYGLASWALVTPTIEFAQQFAADAVSAYARIDQERQRRT